MAARSGAAVSQPFDHRRRTGQRHTQRRDEVSPQVRVSRHGHWKATRNSRFSIWMWIGTALMTAAACQSSTTQPSGAGSLVAPRGVSPAPNASMRYTDQPVTLSTANAVSTQGAATYTFEVATDSGFSNKVQTKADVAEGSGQTSV